MASVRLLWIALGHKASQVVKMRGRCATFAFTRNNKVPKTRGKCATFVDRTQSQGVTSRRKCVGGARHLCSQGITKRRRSVWIALGHKASQVEQSAWAVRDICGSHSLQKASQVAENAWAARDSPSPTQSEGVTSRRNAWPALSQDICITCPDRFHVKYLTVARNSGGTLPRRLSASACRFGHAFHESFPNISSRTVPFDREKKMETLFFNFVLWSPSCEYA